MANKEMLAYKTVHEASILNEEEFKKEDEVKSKILAELEEENAAYKETIEKLRQENEILENKNSARLEMQT